MLLGFAVGDALGAPAAGVCASDFLNTYGALVHFSSNPTHPILGHLNAGEYTENTRLLLSATRDALATGGYSLQRRAQSLRDWALELQKAPFLGRWPGPTTLGSALYLEPLHPTVGQTSTSVGACYRTPPLAATLRHRAELTRAIIKEVRLTHNSGESVAAGLIIGYVLFHTLRGAALHAVVDEVLDAVQHELGVNAVVKKCRQAVELYEKPVDQLREYFGTGAVAHESLPLALALALRFSNDFSSAVCAAANSFRPDHVVPASGLSYEEGLQQVNGGNTDGIAALTGCMVGACVGECGIDQCWQQVEGHDEIRALALRFSDVV